jgi:hypothetical protein
MYQKIAPVAFFVFFYYNVFILLKIWRLLMLCKRCGSRLSERSKICPKCGVKIESETANQQNADNRQTHQYREKIKQQESLFPKKKSKKTIVISIISVLLIGFVITQFFSNGSRMSGDNFEIIEFGGYDWRVLDVRGNRALIITDMIIESRPFHNEEEDITWADSDLRAYLNGEFLDTFSSADRARIIQTHNQNPDNPWFGALGGAVTQDYVFLLSLDELVQYFGDSGQLADQEHSNNEWWWGFNDRFGNARIANHVGQIFSEWPYEIEENEPWFWWLRSPGLTNLGAAVILGDGSVYVYGDVTQAADGGVRPALWLTVG